MINAEIEFEIKINVGNFKGQIIHIKTDIEELEEEDLSSLLIEGGYLDSWCNNNEYSVRNRKITVL